MSALRFVVPMPPNMANGRVHWRVKNKERKAYFATLDGMQLTGQLPKPPHPPMTSVVISSLLHLGAAMDDDNALARIKWPVDWLRSRGYFVDDRRTHCRFEIPGQHIKRDGNYRVELVVTSAPRVNEKGVG